MVTSITSLRCFDLSKLIHIHIEEVFHKTIMSQDYYYPRNAHYFSY